MLASFAKKSEKAIREYQSFDELSIDVIPVVYHFASPLMTKISCQAEGMDINSITFQTFQI